MLIKPFILFQLYQLDLLNIVILVFQSIIDQCCIRKILFSFFTLLLACKFFSFRFFFLPKNLCSLYFYPLLLLERYPNPQHLEDLEVVSTEYKYY